MTDSVETRPVELSDRVEVSVAGLFAEAIRRISRREHQRPLPVTSPSSLATARHELT